MLKRLSQQAEKFPPSPGVYLFRGLKGEALYVGKAKNLQKRIRSYFTGTDERSHIEFLFKHAVQLEYIITDTEKEALLLEQTLIKQFRPRYNIDLRDDKSYISIRLGMEHSSPGISLTRRVLKDGAIYFGPYASSTAAREAVDQTIRNFRIRSCTDREFANRIRPCLKYDMGRCTAPCVGRVSSEAYAEQVEETFAFLKGKRRDLLKRLKKRMQEASIALQYEEAAKLRNTMAMIEETLERQKVIVHGGGDYDIIGMARREQSVAFCTLLVRHGVLMDRRLHRQEATGDDDDLMSSFLLQHYLRCADLPSLLLLPQPIEGKEVIQQILAEHHDGRLTFGVPKVGLKAEMVKLARKNAEEALRNDQNVEVRQRELLNQLGIRLNLGVTPNVIECLDISNLSGREAVGSLVCFVDGQPDKQQYRIYNIRSLHTPNDYEMMREVIMRRFSKHALPDLLLVDGGKGQLHIVLRALEEVGVTGLAVAAIAKPQAVGQSDHIYIAGRKNPMVFRKNAPELLLLMRIRDEAHRFGLKAHRRRRTKRLVG